MNTDLIITLNNNKEFILLLESVHDNNKYFLAVEIKKGKLTEHYELFREINRNGEFFVEEVKDNSLIEVLINEFESQFYSAISE